MIEVIIEKDAALITMANGKDNRHNPAFINEFHEVLDKIEQDDKIRMVIITGKDEKFFSNGYDLDWMMKNIKDEQTIKEFMINTNRLLMRLTVFPKITVAAINGHAFGNGCILAAHMDYRVMGLEKGWVCLPEAVINVPLIPGMVAILKNILSPKSFRDMAYTGKRFNAKEGANLEFIDHAVPHENVIVKSLELASGLKDVNMDSYSYIKSLNKKDVVNTMETMDPQAFDFWINEKFKKNAIIIS